MSNVLQGVHALLSLAWKLNATCVGLHTSLCAVCCVLLLYAACVQSHYECVVVDQEEQRCRHAVYDRAAGPNVGRSVHVAGRSWTRSGAATSTKNYFQERCGSGAATEMLSMVLTLKLYQCVCVCVVLGGCVDLEDMQLAFFIVSSRHAECGRCFEHHVGIAL
jgi:hypothetical protein